MALQKYIQSQIDAGELSLGGVNPQESATIIEGPHQIKKRGVARNLTQAALEGRNTYLDPGGVPRVVRSEPLGNNLNVLTKGQTVQSEGKQYLARNSANDLRKTNARLVEPENMNDLEGNASRKYGHIAKSLQDDSHHITGIASEARHVEGMKPRTREKLHKRKRKYGLYSGDDPRNQSAIPGQRAIDRPDLHTGSLHKASGIGSIKQLLDFFALPNSVDPKVNYVAPAQAQMTESQKIGYAISDAATQRMAVQLNMLDRNSPGSANTIQKSINLIERELLNTGLTKDVQPVENLTGRINNSRVLAQMLRRS